VLIAAGWMNHYQLHIIDYLREENRGSSRSNWVGGECG